jgi:hypothetical protein
MISLLLAMATASFRDARPRYPNGGAKQPANDAVFPLRRYGGHEREMVKNLPRFFAVPTGIFFIFHIFTYQL